MITGIAQRLLQEELQLFPFPPVEEVENHGSALFLIQIS